MSGERTPLQSVCPNSYILHLCTATAEGQPLAYSRTHTKQRHAFFCGPAIVATPLLKSSSLFYCGGRGRQGCADAGIDQLRPRGRKVHRDRHQWGVRQHVFHRGGEQSIRRPFQGQAATYGPGSDQGRDRRDARPYCQDSRNLITATRIVIARLHERLHERLRKCTHKRIHKHCLIFR